MADITILGSGGFGLALAIMCDNAGHKVTVWSKFQDEIDAIKSCLLYTSPSPRD